MILWRARLVVAAVFAATPGVTHSEQIGVERLADLGRADVVVLGEVHDNPVHHEQQARAISALSPKAVVFEMLTEAKALKVRPELIADQQALEQTLDWGSSGWPDFAIYYPIFQAAGDAAIFGGAVPREDARRAVSDGAAMVFGGGAALFGLHDNLDDAEQGEREAGQVAAHCDALPVEMAAGMVEAQRLRDAALARAVVAAMAETGGPVAVITGNGHARRDWGVPRALGLVAPELSVITLGQLEAEPDRPVPYDFWLVTIPVEREDPCAGFDGGGGQD